MRNGSYILALGILLTTGIAAADQSPRASADIDTIISRGDFVPGIPFEADLIRLYGGGQVVTDRTGQYRLYGDIHQSRWVRVSVDDGSSPTVRGVVEVLISATPLSSLAPAAKKPIRSESLKGIRLGSSEAALRMRFGTPATTAKETLGGITCTALVFNPLPNETELYHKYYIAKNKIVAFAVGVTE